MTANVVAIISVSLTAITVIALLLGYIVKATARQVRLEDRMERLEQDHAELERSSKEKFTDYYAFKSAIEKQQEKINSNIENMTAMLKEIKEDLKERK